MATGKDKPKAVVGNFVGVVVRLNGGADEATGNVSFEFLIEAFPAPDTVDRFVPCRLDNPGAWKLRDAGNPPLIYGCGKRFLGRLFGQVEVTDQADQDGNDPAPIGAVQGLDRLGSIERHT